MSRSASRPTSSIDLTTFTPPALPRPPAWICAFSTQTGPPSSLAAVTASAALNATMPRGTGTSNSRSTAFAWYSWIFMRLAHVSRGVLRETEGGKANRSLAEIGGNLLTGVDQGLHRLCGILKHGPLRTVEVDLDDALHPLGADHHGHAEIEVLHAVLAVEPGGGRQHPLLVAQEALGHRDRRARRRIEGGAGLEQADDLAAAVARALDDAVDARRRGPAHLDEIGEWNAGDGRIAHQRHHAVAVAAEHEGGDIFDRDVEFVGEEIAEARRIEHAGHTDDHRLRQPAAFLQGPNHGIERIGDADDEGVGRVFFDARADLLHHLEVDAEEVV